MVKKKTTSIVLYAVVSLIVFIGILFGTYKFITLDDYVESEEGEGNIDITQAANEEGSTVKSSEAEQVHTFVSESHDRWNLLLCYGNWKHYDFNDLRRNISIYEAEFDEMLLVVNDDRIKQDIQHARTLLKIGLKDRNRTAMIYVHRIFHDLDIAYNGYAEKGFGGYSTLANGEEAINVLSFINKNNK